MKKLWIFTFFAVLIWSAISPFDYFTWFLEVLPALIGFIILYKTQESFPLTNLLYILILIHAIILMIGGHYTYAEVPLFNTIRDSFDLTRNNYDKVGHLAQGFVPAIIVREIFIRKQVIALKTWRNFLIISVCLGFSAFYELLEWWVALFSGDSAEAFLGTQGFIWDTQSDMGFALLGSALALLTLKRFHDRQLGKVVNCRKETGPIY